MPGAEIVLLVVGVNQAMLPLRRFLKIIPEEIIVAHSWHLWLGWVSRTQVELLPLYSSTCRVVGLPNICGRQPNSVVEL